MNLIFPLITKRLILQPFSLDDVEKVYQMSNELGIQKWIPDQVYRDEAHANRVLANLIQNYNNVPSPQKAPFVLGVYLSDNHELIGHVGLSPYRGNVEIGYAVENCQQGRGYATEAVIAMTQWGMKRWELPYILGVVDAGNTASCRVLEKAGYSLYQTIRKNMRDRAEFEKIYKK